MFKQLSKQSPPAGARPGTLELAEDALPCRIHVFDYTADALVEADINAVSELTERWNDVATITWIDVQGLGTEDVLWRLAEIFGLHSLLLEDVVHVPQRPKVESYDNHLFWVTQMIREREDGTLNLEQVSVICGESWVLTFQERYGDVLDPIRKRLRRGLGQIRGSQADYLAYTILDTIVDGYFPLVESVAERLEGIDEEILRDPSTEMLGRLHSFKQVLLTLRRTFRPQREALNQLLRDPEHAVSERTRLYLRDTYDHCVHAAELSEVLREYVGELTNLYVSAVSNRMNEVMKVLTVIATIFIPLTFLAGVYGMNFRYMPELEQPWAYPLLLAVMALLGGGLWVWFYRKGWIGPSP